MKSFKHIFSFLLCIFLFSSCGVTYPKENLTDLLEEMVKKETGIDSEAVIIGQTLYLDIELEGFVSDDRMERNNSIKNLETAIHLTTRVVLSSDSDVKYMVINSFDPNKEILIRMVQNIRDVKDYLYTRISRDDYASRNLMEMGAFDDMIEEKHDISDGEFLGRMILSQLTINNPFIVDIIKNIQLQYAGFENKVLILLTFSEMDNKSLSILSKLLYYESKKYADKYKMEVKSINIVDKSGNIILDLKLKENAGI